MPQNHPTKLCTNRKEMLAIVLRCTKFHDYIYGVPEMKVESDHKPSEAILKAPTLSSTPTTKDADTGNDHTLPNM